MGDERKHKGKGKSFRKMMKKKFTDVTGIPLDLQRPVDPSSSSKRQEESKEMIVLKKAYHFNVGACRNFSHQTGNCRNNPKCLKGFGEFRDGIWREENELGSFETKLRDDNQIYIGLKNLGATCYIASLLQALFMNFNFRQMIFDYRGDDKLCGLLKLLFTQLQETNKSYCTPKLITNYLNIQTSIQQDVQEFNNLFISKLESTLGKSDNPNISKFIPSEFQGVSCYETKCKSCGNVSGRNTPFKELELSIANNSSLSGCFKTLLKEETLSGDNKYNCDNCGPVNAVRRLKLIDLPPVLNIQLLRFVYDASTGKKKKLSNQITFPYMLDMSSYVGSKEKNPNCMYQLKAVLLHLGNSASSGHYIAHIQDEATKQWWKFNDTKVTPLELKDVGYTEPQVDEERGTREKAKSLLTVLGKKKVTSTDAYMVIYVRVKDRPIITPKPPEDTHNIVMKANESLLKKYEEWQSRKSEIKSMYIQHKEIYEQFMKVAQVAVGENYNWIDAVWFSKWVKGDTTSPVDNREILCVHDKVDPKKIQRLKVVHEKGWNYLSDVLGEGGPILTGKDCCFICAEQTYEHRVAEQGKQNELRKMLSLARNNFVQDGYWVSARWLHEWTEYAPHDKLEYLSNNMTQDITCDHGNLCCKGSERRLICTELWSYLRFQFGEGPEFHRSVSVCPVCKDMQDQAVATMKDRRMERGQQKYALQSLTRGLPREIPSGRYFVISADWHREWYQFVTKPQIDTLKPFDIRSLLCEHELLKYDPLEKNTFCINPSLPTKLVTEEEWVKIKEFYGDVPGVLVELEGDKSNQQATILPPICEDCYKITEEQETLKKMNYATTKIWIEIPGASHISSVLSLGAKTSSTQRFPIVVAVDDTIHILKLKIMQKLNIQPIKQQLSYRGEELENTKTIFDYRIIPNARVIFSKIKSKDAKEYETGDNDTVSPGTIPIEPIHIPHHVIEQGFEGSLLAGDEPEHDEEDKDEWSCPDCTMINQSSASACIVCDLPNPNSFNDEVKHEEPEEELWTCKFCTVPNEQKNNRCIACEKLRQ